MGIPLSLALDVNRDIPIRSDQSQRLWRPFPSRLKAEPGQLLMELPAIHPSLGQPKEENLYWWVDCQFVPFDNCQLIASAGAYILRPQRTWVPCKGLRPGLITHWQLDKSVPVCGVFKGTQTSARPQIQIHPDGKYIGFVDRGCVRVIDTDNHDRYSIDDDTRPVSHKYCAFSPDGISIAVLFRNLRHFELEINTLAIRARKDSRIICHKLCPDFTASRLYTEEVECKFSPDSQLVALSHSNGVLFTVKKSPLSLHCQIFPGVVSDTSLCNERSYDFDPSFGHNIVACGGADRSLYICDIEQRKILYKKFLDSDSEGNTIDGIQYSPNGSQLAVAMSDFSILLFSTPSLEMCHKLCMKEKCQNVVIQLCIQRLPVVTRMRFDKTGQHLVVGSSDGKLRIWQLFVTTNLRYLCKLQIQQCCSVKDIKKLPLPPSLINFLLSDVS